MRAFLGFDCPDSLHEQLEKAVKPLKSIDGFKPVKPVNYHITVKFLGEISQDLRSRIDVGMQKGLPTVGPLHVELNGAGVFPDPGNASVALAGVDHPPGLIELQNEVEDITTNLGIEPENREYHPHVTLGRFKSSAEARTVREWIQSASGQLTGEWTVDELVLFESELGADGPTHTRHERWPL
ncbi:MAG: RNA 2',3'-cyclic phosphodiesterase [bacterium]